ncbi:MAG: TIGR01440 family protein [Clostridium sp.]|nr:TIGR01440 family protein [Clostridium sp.]
MEEKKQDIIGSGVADTAADKMEVDRIKSQIKQMLGEFFEAAGMKEGQILVVGCSSSEIEAHRIGSYSSREVGQAVFQEIYQETQKRGIYLAAQCCEHLNRALIVEEACAEKYGLEQVNVVPQLKAGGSFATAAFEAFQNPAAVERIQAHGGIDIGDTFIGMHLRPVAVPVRTSVREIGSAHVTCARTRLKCIGGERAKYR